MHHFCECIHLRSVGRLENLWRQAVIAGLLMYLTGFASISDKIWGWGGLTPCPRFRQLCVLNPTDTMSVLQVVALVLLDVGNTLYFKSNGLWNLSSTLKIDISMTLVIAGLGRGTAWGVVLPGYNHFGSANLYATP